jgi:phage replication-related protein YjqB (UPF0714/DUF867 family)
MMWPFDSFADRATRLEAVERARYAIKIHGREAEAYLRTKMGTPGRSRRGQTMLRLALRELDRLRHSEFSDLLDRQAG